MRRRCATLLDQGISTSTPVACDEIPTMSDSTVENHQTIYPKSGRVVPVVRWAHLVQAKPQLSKRTALRIAAGLVDAWESRCDDFRGSLALVTGIPEARLRFVSPEREQVRQRFDGTTPMVDFPRIQAHNEGGVDFDARICVAICADELSSKAWGRVGLPLEPTTDLPPDDDLDAVMELFRKIARHLASWGREFFLEVANRKATRHRFHDNGELDISVLSVPDEEIAEGLSRLSESELTAEDLLNDPKYASQVSSYIKAMTDIRYPLSELRRKEPNSFWFASTNTAIDEDGVMEPRTMLYLLRPQGEVAQISGVGFDGSGTGSLVRDSAVDVSRIVANRV